MKGFNHWLALYQNQKRVLDTYWRPQVSKSPQFIESLIFIRYSFENSFYLKSALPKLRNRMAKKDHDLISIPGPSGMYSRDLRQENGGLKHSNSLATPWKPFRH
jgi:hypothetical protein